MNKIQIQISEIDNGWIVASGGVASKTEGVLVEPIALYCDTYVEVCNALKAIWPISSHVE